MKLIYILCLTVGAVLPIQWNTTVQADAFELFATSGGSVLKIDSSGQWSPFVTPADGMPLAIVFDSQGNLLLSQHANGKIQNIREFSRQGDDLGVFASIGTINPFQDLEFGPAGYLYASEFSINRLWRFSPKGNPEFVGITGDGPAGLAFDDSGNLFVALVNQSGGSIAKYSPSLSLLKTFGQGLLSAPVGLAFGRDGLLYVSNLGTDDIRRFTPEGAFVDVFASSGLSDPHDLEFDPDGNLYVANNRSGTIREFSATGEDLGNFVSGLSFPIGLSFRVVPEPVTSGMPCLIVGLMSLRKRLKRSR